MRLHTYTYVPIYIPHTYIYICIGVPTYHIYGGIWFNVYPSHLPTIVFINEILITVYAVKIADVQGACPQARMYVRSTYIHTYIRTSKTIEFHGLDGLYATLQSISINLNLRVRCYIHMYISRYVLLLYICRLSKKILRVSKLHSQVYMQLLFKIEARQHVNWIGMGYLFDLRARYERSVTRGTFRKFVFAQKPFSNRIT